MLGLGTLQAPSLWDRVILPDIPDLRRLFFDARASPSVSPKKKKKIWLWKYQTIVFSRVRRDMKEEKKFGARRKNSQLLWIVFHMGCTLEFTLHNTIPGPIHSRSQILQHIAKNFSVTIWKRFCISFPRVESRAGSQVYVLRNRIARLWNQIGHDHYQGTTGVTHDPCGGTPESARGTTGGSPRDTRGSRGGAPGNAWWERSGSPRDTRGSRGGAPGNARGTGIVGWIQASGTEKRYCIILKEMIKIHVFSKEKIPKFCVSIFLEVERVEKKS